MTHPNQSTSGLNHKIILALCWPVLSGILTLWMISTLQAFSGQPLHSADPVTGAAGVANTPPSVTSGRLQAANRFRAAAPEQPATEETIMRVSAYGELTTVLRLAAQHHLSVETRRELTATIRSLAALPEGTDLLARIFFGDDTEVSEALYRLILNGDLRSADLIEKLVLMADMQASDTSRTLQLLDLTGDLLAHAPADWQPPAILISYLHSLISSPDPRVESAALSQWIWLASGGDELLTATDTYLAHPDTEVRLEWYDRMLESPPADPIVRAQILIRLREIQQLHTGPLSQQELRLLRRLEIVLGESAA